MLRPFKPEMKILQVGVGRRTEPSFGLEVFVGVRLAFRIQLQLDTPAWTARRIGIRPIPVDVHMILQYIQRPIQQRPQHMRTERFAEGLIGIEGRRFRGGRMRVEYQDEEQRRQHAKAFHTVMLANATALVNPAHDATRA